MFDRRLPSVVGLTLALVAVAAAVAPTSVLATATFVVNKIGDQPDLNLANSKCDVSSNSGNQCTLRAAIQEANDTAGVDTINFNITSSSKVIAPASPLPTITERVTINGYTQPGAAANTSLLGTNAVLKIVIDGVNAGVAANGLVVGGSRSLIKGLVVQRFAKDGIVITASEVQIQGNYIGTNTAGSAARPNGVNGISITNANNVEVGGLTPGARNVISGNSDGGIAITGGQFDNVHGNYIGTTAAGTADLGNFRVGVHVEGGDLHTVGGMVSGAGNVISGNGRDAIYLADTTHSLVAGNLLGTDAAGLLPLGNGGNGVQLDNADNNQVGGTTVASRNTIADSQGGIEVLNSDGNIIQGNRIGTKADGTGNLANRFRGIQVTLADNNLIGGTGGAGNIIANTTNADGIFIAGDATGNVVQGNSITNNSGAGVQLTDGPNEIVGNVIAANGKEGVLISWSGGALDGIRISGNQMLANGRLGINLSFLGDSSSGVTANDSGDGDVGPNNLQNFPVLTTAIRSLAGVTTVSGSLNSTASTQFRIELFLALADASGHGEAQVMLAAQNITTNSAGNKSFTFQVAGVAPGLKLTSTAIDQSTDDTSEFSTNVTVVQGI